MDAARVGNPRVLIFSTFARNARQRAFDVFASLPAVMYAGGPAVAANPSVSAFCCSASFAFCSNASRCCRNTFAEAFTMDAAMIAPSSSPISSRRYARDG